MHQSVLGTEAVFGYASIHTSKNLLQFESPFILVCITTSNPSTAKKQISHIEDQIETVRLLCYPPAHNDAFTAAVLNKVRYDKSGKVLKLTSNHLNFSSGCIIKETD